MWVLKISGVQKLLMIISYDLWFHIKDLKVVYSIYFNHFTNWISWASLLEILWHEHTIFFRNLISLQITILKVPLSHRPRERQGKWEHECEIEGKGPQRERTGKREKGKRERKERERERREREKKERESERKILRFVNYIEGDRKIERERERHRERKRDENSFPLKWRFF